jgi:hypothetical protein
VIFTGSGCTGAIDKLVGILGLRIPADLDDRYHLSDAIPADERPVVFIGPFEHHSNELPWRESIADVVVIPEDADGHIDVAAAGRPSSSARRPAAEDRVVLRGEQRHRHRQRHPPSPRCCTSTARCRSGTSPRPGRTSTSRCTAARGPRPAGLQGRDLPQPAQVHRRPGTPGVLVARRELLRNRVPDVVGGGTVAYVNPSEHRYLDDPVHREEGGTPAIVESIRAGLVFQLKQAVGVDVIRAHEARLPAPGGRPPGDEPAIEILGNLDAERLSIVSFVVRAARAGGTCTTTSSSRCSTTCSASSPAAAARAPGPYGHRLLGIDLERSHEFEREIAHGCEGIKPGWVRVNFNYFISEVPCSLHRRRGRGTSSPTYDGWRCSPGLPLRPGDRAVAAPRLGPVEPPLRLQPALTPSSGPVSRAEAPAQVHGYASSSHAKAASARSSGRNVSTMTAYSSVRTAPMLASTLPGCGPWVKPLGCRVIDPISMPAPLRLMKSPPT